MRTLLLAWAGLVLGTVAHAQVATTARFGVTRLTYSESDMVLNGADLATDPIATAAVTYKPATGVIQLQRVVAPASMTVTNAGYEVTTAGALLSATANTNGIAIYTTAGVRLGFANCASTFTSTGIKTTAFDTPVALTAGTVYVLAWVTTGTTTVTLRAANAAPMININTVSPAFRYASKTGALAATLDLTTGITAQAVARASLFAF